MPFTWRRGRLGTGVEGRNLGLALDMLRVLQVATLHGECGLCVCSLDFRLDLSPENTARICKGRQAIPAVGRRKEGKGTGRRWLSLMPQSI